MPAMADSFITSPSWPVRRSSPLPGMTLTSISRVSPPTLVQARPRTIPMSSASFRRSDRCSAPCRDSSSRLVSVTLMAFLAFLQKLPRRFPADLADLPLQAHAHRLPGCRRKSVSSCALSRDGKIMAARGRFSRSVSRTDALLQCAASRFPCSWTPR